MGRAFFRLPPACLHWIQPLPHSSTAQARRAYWAAAAQAARRRPSAFPKDKTPELCVIREHIPHRTVESVE